MRRIGWQGVTRSRQMRDLLHERFLQWRAGWLGDSWPEASVELAEQGAVEAPATACWSFDAGEGILKVAGPADMELRLAALALRMEARADDPIGKEVGMCCLADLGWSLQGAASAGLSHGWGCLDEIDCNPRFGGARLRVMGLPLDISIAVDRTWCSRQVPMREGAGRALTDRRVALGSTRVRVAAVVDLGEMPLLESTGWKQGELLVTDTDVDRGGAVHLSVGGITMASGTVVARDGARSIAIS